MAALYKWKQPDRVTELAWEQAKEQLKKLRAIWIKWWVSLASLCFYIVYRLEPQTAERIGITLLMCTVIIPLWFYVVVWSATIHGERYEIDKNGLIKRAGSSSEFHKWHNIEYYRIIDHEDVQGVKAVEFKVSMPKKPKKWSFNPAEVDETILRRLLEEHLPGKNWDSAGASYPDGEPSG